MKERIHIKIYGLVQGVFFRIETKKIADKLGLTGWVRNMQDNTVGIVAEGPEEKLLKLKEWCETGPEHSTVEKIETKIKPATNEFEGFKIES
jgi:acylphosphatase